METGGLRVDKGLTDFYLWADLQPYAWFTLFALLSLTDGAITVYGIKRGATEANPVIKWLAKHVGIIPTLAARCMAGVASKPMWRIRVWIAGNVAYGCLSWCLNQPTNHVVYLREYTLGCI